MHLLSQQGRFLIFKRFGWISFCTIGLNRQLLLLLLHEQLLDHKVLKRVKFKHAEHECKNEHQTFSKTTNIADPVKNAVDGSINPALIQVKFESYLHVNVIGELVRPDSRRLV